MSEMKKTIFLDIDGCILKHHGNLSKLMTSQAELLPGVLDKLNEWEGDGHKIILVTGRKESMRKMTEDQLANLGIFFDQLVMGINRGERIIINDKKIMNGVNDNNTKVATAIEVCRNSGLTNIII
jgi:hydroxymethylpyrimidine pyrophosphatase-like HAD family hydrolase